jgi:hypothetical protein
MKRIKKKQKKPRPKHRDTQREKDVLKNWVVMMMQMKWRKRRNETFLKQ